MYIYVYNIYIYIYIFLCVTCVNIDVPGLISATILIKRFIWELSLWRIWDIIGVPLSARGQAQLACQSTQEGRLPQHLHVKTKQNYNSVNGCQDTRKLIFWEISFI